MPELPEVETVRRGLEERIIGRRVRAISYDWPKSFPNSQEDVAAFLQSARATAVRRRAKVIIVDLDTGWSLIVHLKMTGQLVFIDPADESRRFGAGHPNDSLISALPDASTRVHLQFEGGASLYFNDQRKFGWVKLVPTGAIEELDFFRKLGPEPLEPGFSKTLFRSRFVRRPNTAIKAALIDQSVVAGVGNIYADESLWAARIHPATRVALVSSAKLNRLHDELLRVLLLAIEKGGSTDRNYVDASGQRGSYLSFARAFRRDGLPCPRCGRLIQKIRVAGRGTHVCTYCQRRRLA
jgi:formamidopyrimidine-DNA glycosylase